jgi:hypothetical protein
MNFAGDDIRFDFSNHKSSEVPSARVELATSRFLVVRLCLLDYDGNGPSTAPLEGGARLRPKCYLSSPQRVGVKSCEKREIRTLTELGLNQLPLPLGYTLESWGQTRLAPVL